MKKIFLLLFAFITTLSACKKNNTSSADVTTQAAPDDAIIQAYVKPITSLPLRTHLDYIIK